MFNILGGACTYKGLSYQEGESFKDDCNTCKCTGGKVTCTLMACRKYYPVLNILFSQFVMICTDISTISLQHCSVIVKTVFCSFKETLIVTVFSYYTFVQLTLNLAHARSPSVEAYVQKIALQTPPVRESRNVVVMVVDMFV